MEPYAKPDERRVGANRPKIQHLPPDPAQHRTRADRQAEKQSVAAERRGIKKRARRSLKKQMLGDLPEAD